MIVALIHKELRELKPWGVLSIAAGLLAVVPNLLMPVDMLPLGSTFTALNDTNAFLFWLMAFAIGSGLTTREETDGTLAFLDGLPLTRTRVFLVKSVVIFLLVLLAPFVRFVSTMGFHLLSRGSLDHDLHVPLLLQGFGLQALVIAHGVFLGAALGRLRAITWLALAALATGLVLLMQRYPRAAVLNPLSVLGAELTPSRLAVDGEALWIHVSVTAVAFLLAWLAFVRIGRARKSRPTSRPITGALTMVATVVVVLVAGAVWWRTRMTTGGDDFAFRGVTEPYFAPSAPAQTQTRHYQISYPAEESQAALQMAAQADAIFERVHELLHVPLGAPIDVDASGSNPNTEGTAYLGRIRVRLGSDIRIVLAHETTHVVAQRLAGGERDWLWENASVLNEGLATWVHYHFAAQSHEREQGMLVLAALQTRRELFVDELTDPDRLAATRDDNLKYPAGEALVAAMVRLYGSEALPKLLRAFADPRLPSDLQGMELWRSTFQLAGMNFGLVVDEFYREVSSYAEQHATRIAALPRPRVRLVREGNRVGVQALIDRDLGDAGPIVQLRFRPALDSSIEELDTENALFGQPVWRHPSQIAGGRVCVQAGLTGFAKQVLYEPWICMPVRDAAPWQAQMTGDR